MQQNGSKVSQRVLLLDRDGVLNENRDAYVRGPDNLAVFPQAAEAVARLVHAGFRVLVITNQAGVGKGLISPATLEAIHAKLQATLAKAGGSIARFYVCPHLPDANCGCRKPRPGLILRAQQEWGFEPASTWMVGDAEKDIKAALAAGCRPAMIRTGVSGTASGDVPMFDDLSGFVSELLGSTPAP